VAPGRPDYQPGGRTIRSGDGRPPAGPARTRGLCADAAGFGLRAATRAGAYDARARKALVKYILRPPVPPGHPTFAPEGLVRIALKRPFRDGTSPSTWILDRFCAAWPPTLVRLIRIARLRLRQPRRSPHGAR